MWWLPLINLDKKNVIFAKNFITKLRGLYARNLDTILVIWNCNDIHSAFFRKNLDLAFFDKSAHVIKSVREFKPWNRLRVPGSSFVIERYANKEKDWFSNGEQINFKFKGGENESMSSM